MQDKAASGLGTVAPVIVLDADGLVTHVSETIPPIFGYDGPADFVGRRYREFWAHPDEALRAKEEFRRAGRWQGAFLARHRQGHAFPAHGKAWAAQAAPGDLSAVMLVSPSEQSPEALALFSPPGAITLPEVLVRGAIHDLNNIIAVATGGLGLLRPAMSRAGPMEKETFAMVEESCERATGLLKEMGGWLASWAGKDAGVKDVDVGRLAVGAARLAALGTKVAVEPPIAENLWPARCDEAGMFRVLVNLALNARQAMGGSGRLSIKAENVWDPKEGFFVRLSMSDTGPGMAGEALAHAFDLGFTTKAGGSGVGLAVARHIVARNGGRMEVESSPGRGTTFRLLLPAARPAGRDS